jgi:hypothetical protein
MQHVVWSQPEIAHAVRCLPLLDQLELTVELLTDAECAEPELPSNVLRFRPRRVEQALLDQASGSHRDGEPHQMATNPWSTSLADDETTCSDRGESELDAKAAAR